MNKPKTQMNFEALKENAGISRAEEQTDRKSLEKGGV